MKDPTTPNSEDRKKIMFYDSSDRQIRLKIRCGHDGITQSQFFRMMVTGYIDANPGIIEYIQSCKDKYQLQGSQKINKLKKLSDANKQTVTKFNIGDEEIENIFDIIEMETGI